MLLPQLFKSYTMKTFTWNKDKKSYSTKIYLLIWLVIIVLLWSMECLGNIFANAAATKFKSTWLVHASVMFSSIYIFSILANICLKPFIKQPYIKEISALILANLLYFLINPFIYTLLIPDIKFVNQFNLFGTVFQILIYSIVYAIIHHFRLSSSKKYK
jgi:hypothetical protein